MQFNVKKIEEEILRFWKKQRIFEKSVKNRKGKKNFVFYEGPPSANALPHIGHFETRAFKDVFCRYKTMRGFYAPRRAGWDTHGLPIEVQVEKELGFKSKQDIEKFGIDKFNARAKALVWKYKEEWERFTHRMGFWIDTSDPYITYDHAYIESLWWTISQIWKRKLLYKDFKVVPYCARCGTALSSHEVALGYKNVEETSVYVQFKIKPQQKLGDIITDDHTYILSWTTTPWTLPGNVALAIGEDIEYVLVQKGNEKFIIAKSLAEEVLSKKYTISQPKEKNPFKTKQSESSKIEIIKEVTGKQLVGLVYEPLFHVPQLKSPQSYRIYPADFVTTEEGTGVVHTAVMYGQEDFELGTKHALPKFHTVDDNGRFIKGLGYGLDESYVKDEKTEKTILSHLEEHTFLFSKIPYRHDYPFCWRCTEPLLYYARDSWFVAVSKVQEELIKNNNAINWYPKHIKDGRFGEWLRGVKDWAFSRERYWGTPLPVWECGVIDRKPAAKNQHKKSDTGCGHRRVIGSLQELEKYRYRKKNTIFIMRHGLSEKNFSDSKRAIIASKLKNDTYRLLPEGIKDVERAVKQIEKEGGIDLIFASPFKRTQETAQIFAQHFGHRVHTDNRLKELDHGTECEGKTHPVCVSPDVLKSFDLQYGHDGEKWQDVKNRIISFIRDIDAQHEEKRILVVSHGDPLWILWGAVQNLDNDILIEIREKQYFNEAEYRELPLKNYPYDDRGELNLHRPYIDAIVLRCDQCDGEMHRVPEVVDAWFDSGAMPLAQWHYPFEHKKDIDTGNNNQDVQFPADFITEGVDQTRGWFYTLLAVSTLLGRGAPYKNVISLGHVLDEKGDKMSKSKGNVVDPFMVMDTHGADVLRWYMYTVNGAGEPKQFSMQELSVYERGVFATIMNSLRFLKLYAPIPTDKTIIKDDVTDSTVLDRWIESKLQRTIHVATTAMDGYDVTTATRAIQSFIVDDLSNWWIRRSRTRFQNGDTAAIARLTSLFKTCARILAPFVPFLAEYIYRELHGIQKEHASIHLYDWPIVQEDRLDDELESNMHFVRDVISRGLAQRKQKKIRVRQPLSLLEITVQKERKGLDDDLLLLIKDEMNVKDVRVHADPAIENEIDVRLDSKITPALRIEGLAREFVRKVQDIRKDAGYAYDQKVTLSWFTDHALLRTFLEAQQESIKKKTMLADIIFEQHNEKKVFDVEKEVELEAGVSVWFGIKA